ncbi:unnamed protein product [Fructobacillus fructosus]|uniref:Phage protein n=1 Tax=Fructobacillus fructosus TaxID=1631 RepID=A0ABM9MMF6_9LACO|nr:unnamed protein product [Fructobacillus fructosus]
MEQIIFKKATMNDQLPETAYMVENHMDGFYFVDDAYLRNCLDDPFYCEMCGDSDRPIAEAHTPLEMLVLLVEQYSWSKDIREMPDKGVLNCLRQFVNAGSNYIVVRNKDFNDALQALIAYRESEKQNAGGEE